MKLRIRGNSLRLRLDQAEVRELLKVEAIVDHIRFGPLPHQRLTYQVSITEGEATCTAEFSNGMIHVFVNRLQAQAWESTEQIGIEATQEIGSGEVLRILIEKDFACLQDRPNEDDAHAYPNPKIC